MKTNEIVEGGRFTPEFYLDSGSILVNQQLNSNGWPAGSMIHLYSSQEGSFKTSLALHGMINAQDRGMRVGFVDAEKSLDVEWAKSMGLSDDPDLWVYSMPEDGETALQHTETMIEDYGCKVVVLDSVDASQPSKYHEEEYGDAVMMVHAKLMNKFARRISGVLKNNQAICFAINQMRTAGGNGMSYNKPSGGKGLPFYSALNMEMRRNTSPSNLVGAMDIPLLFRIRRSKIGRSFRDIETIGRQGVGIDRSGELVQLALNVDFLQRAGSWYKGKKNEDGKRETVGQHIDLAREYVKEHEQEILELANAQS
ncbi:hypothetical protein ACKGJO_06490 [Gracilimonas sp. Q87]|uniref:hypothetical protein n=1 Tax=Gracilimonas sp. Q87 TaxID=3384766 RepID=UPI0039845497